MSEFPLANPARQGLKDPMSEALEQEKPYAIGIDLGGTNLRAALVSREGKVCSFEKTKTPVEEGPAATVRAMAGLVSRLLQGEILKGEGFDQVAGIGIGSPGPLSRSRRMIFQTANLPGFDRYPMGDSLEEQTGLPVKIDNDAKCAAYGEKAFGVAQGCNNVVVLTFGTGIGGGVFVDDKMVYGKSDGACELGHMTLYPGGIQCSCGNRGCMEKYISATAFEHRAHEHRMKHMEKQTGSRPTQHEAMLRGPEIFEAYNENIEWAVQHIDTFVEDTAMSVASLLSIFNPELVVLSGGLFTTGGGPLPGLVQKNLKGRTYASLIADARVASSTLGGEAGVLGAASLAFE